MLWSILFTVGLVQGIFLIGVFFSRKSQNRLATQLLSALLLLFVLSNFDDLLLATQWYAFAPKFFGTSMAAFFAYGPLFYLYIQATTNPSFKWKWKTWLHFLPFFGCFILYFPLLMMPTALKADMLNDFLAGKFPMRIFDVVMALLKIVIFSTYLYLAYRQIIKVRVENNTAWQVPFQLRAKWLHELLSLFSLILLALITVSIWNISNWQFVPNVNFAFTFITCSIMYFIAFKLMTQPALATPDFTEKYSTVRFQKEEEENLMLELMRFLEVEKIFTDPDLKLRSLADELKIPPHRLSMIINERFGKSFSEFINQHRINEFINRLNDPAYANFTMHGLALEVGFNSKSAFNAAFKKITGKTPSDFKK